MFTAKIIREMMNAKDFRPFRIYMSDGKSYEVENQDMAIITQNSVDIGIHPDPDGIAEKLVRCAIIHITRIEDLQPA
jgi:hypothetical protein